MEPEEKLWQQVIFRALCDALGFTNLSRVSKERDAVVQEAREWFYKCDEDIELCARFAGLDGERVKKAGIMLIEARQSGDHSQIPAFWRDAFKRNRMPSFTAYADEIDKALKRG